VASCHWKIRKQEKYNLSSYQISGNIRKFLKELKVEESKIKKINNCIMQHMGPLNGYFFSKMLEKEGKTWDFLRGPLQRNQRFCMRLT
jgi:hypothetical protein